MLCRFLLDSRELKQRRRRRGRQLQKTMALITKYNKRANEQGCKEINRILQNHNVKSPDFTLCRERELEDANQFIFRSHR